MELVRASQASTFSDVSDTDGIPGVSESFTEKVGAAYRDIKNLGSIPGVSESCTETIEMKGWNPFVKVNRSLYNLKQPD